MTNDALSGKWPKCDCKPSKSSNEVVANTVVPIGTVGADGGAGVGAVVGYGLGAHEAAAMARVGLALPGILAIADGIFSGAVAGGVVGGAVGVLVGGIVAAAILLPDPFCNCDKLCK